MATHRIQVGIFDSRAAADRAIDDLKAAGYRNDQIGLVGQNREGKTFKTDGSGETTSVAEGAAVGAAAGAATAAAVGAGVMFGVIPVIGPILALGPLAVTLINAASGAVLAGIAGALMGMGLPKEDATFYEGEVAKGRFLVTLEADEETAREVYARHGGYDRATATGRAV